MANGRIDENGLPVYAPGDFDYVRVVDRSTGASRNALVPEVTAAARLLTEKLGEVVAEAEADIAPVIAGLGYLPPVPYASGLNVNSTRFTVIRDGQVYAPAAPVPFTTGAWDAAQWRLIQGVAGADLASEYGAGMVGFSGGGSVDAALKNRLQIQQADITVTVGTGGDFSTVNAAIDFLARKRPAYKQRGYVADILLMSGFVMAEQIMVKGIDLSWIWIRSVDPVVTVRRSDITIKPTTEAFRPVFFGEWKASLPVIDVLFDMDSTGAADGQSGVWVDVNSTVTFGGSGAGVMNCPGRGLHVSSGSFAYARGTVWDGAGIGVRVSNGSICQLRNGSAKNCTIAGTSCEGSLLNFTNADFSGSPIGGTFTGCTSYLDKANFGNATVTGGLVVVGGTAYASEAITSGCLNHGLAVRDGATVDFTNGVGNGCAGNSILVENGASVTARLANLSSSGIDGINASGNCRVNARGANISNCARHGVNAQRGSFVDVTNANASASGTGYGAIVANGSIVSANGMSGTTFPAENTLRPQGIIFTNAVVRASGTATIPSGATFIDVAHGCAYTPAAGDITITPIDAMGVATKFWQSTRTATHFRINVDVDPGSSASFAWQVDRK